MPAPAGIVRVVIRKDEMNSMRNHSPLFFKHRFGGRVRHGVAAAL